MTRSRASVTGACSLSIVIAVGVAVNGQDPAFAVASIKRSTSGLLYSQSTDPADGVALVNERLRDVILFAYGLYEFQLAGDPPWVVSRDRFDSLREQLGLELVSRRARVAFLVVESVAPPTPD
jgi:hypothetical protein